jgi:filamentous hemagglutinin family protein
LISGDPSTILLWVKPEADRIRRVDAKESNMPVQSSSSQHMRFDSFAVRSISLAASCAFATPALAAPLLPQGGQFVAGSGSINQGGQSLTINQGSSRGIIDWRSFSIGDARTVTFNNGHGVTLNRVTGTDASTITGMLTATGSVYLINPNGVLIGPSGVITTAGRFVASTLDVSNAAFMKGDTLTLSGNGTGTVVNMGKIGSTGGDVFLVSRSAVTNQGTITAPKGTAEMAAGAQVLLQDSASGQQVFVNAGSGGSVTNGGAIRAAQVNLQAADGNVFALASNDAAIRATGTAKRDGHVWLVADKGTVHANGVTYSVDANGGGGDVDTRAATLDLAGATMYADRWTIATPALRIGHPEATAISTTLNAGTSVTVTTNVPGAAGAIMLNVDILWTGSASLAMESYFGISTAPLSLIQNVGTGNLSLRADAAGVDNHGLVNVNGNIDWSRSTGLVSMYSDMNASPLPGLPHTYSNLHWTPPAYSGIVSQATTYMLVNNAADLAMVSQNLKGTYALGRDIDLSATKTTTYSPIGPSLSSAFTGQFDGLGHVISNLNIRVPSDGSLTYAGLFGVIGAGGVVRDLGVSNAKVSGGVGGLQGVLAGRSDGTLAVDWSTGSVGSNRPFAGVAGGGLVGANHGTIERSWSGASVGGQGIYGGLASENDGTIVQSYATGAVHTADTHSSSAGLVYTNNGLIDQTYSTGAVSTLKGDGAFVGYNSNTGQIEQSFFAGKAGLTSNLDDYGAIASQNAGTVGFDVYWNRDTTHHSVAVTDNYLDHGAIPPSSNGLSTAQMSNPASFNSWDFSPSGVWVMPSGGTHPLLRWQQTAQ